MYLGLRTARSSGYKFTRLNRDGVLTKIVGASLNGYGSEVGRIKLDKLVYLK